MGYADPGSIGVPARPPQPTSPNAVPAPASVLKSPIRLHGCDRKPTVEAALGRSVSGGVEQKGVAQSTCDYTGDGAVTIALVHSNDKLDPEGDIAELKKLLPAGALREATGVGARAYFVDIPYAGSQLHVFRGEHDYLMVSVLGFGGPAQVSEAVIKIARMALDRL